MRTAFVIGLLLMTCLAWGDKWVFVEGHPELSEGDWRSKRWAFFDTTISADSLNKKSPFYTYNVTSLDDIAFGANSDFQPADGWELIYAYLGEYNDIASSGPQVVLYNKFTGILRVFYWDNRQQGCTEGFIKIEVTGGPMSISSYQSSSYVLAMDKRDVSYLNNTAIKYIPDPGGDWLYADFYMAYDTMDLVDDCDLRITIRGTTLTTASLEMEGMVTAHHSAPSLSAIETIEAMGNHVSNYFKDGLSWRNSIEGAILAEKLTDNGFVAKMTNTLSDGFSWARRKGATGMIPYLSGALGIVQLFTGGLGNGPTITNYTLEASITGELHTETSLSAFTISMPGSVTREVTPFYNEPLGIVNIEESPVVYEKFALIGGAGTYKYSYCLPEFPDFAINPDSGLNPEPIEFKVGFSGIVSGNESYGAHLGPGIIEHHYYNVLRIENNDPLNMVKRFSTLAVDYVPNEDLYLNFYNGGLDEIGVTVIAKFAYNDPNREPYLFCANYLADIDYVGTCSAFPEYNVRQLVREVCNEEHYHDTTINIDPIRQNIVRGGQLTYENCTVNINSTRQYNGEDIIGIDVQDGSVEFSNCTVNLTNNGFLRACGEDSVIRFTNGSVLNVSAYTWEEQMLSDGAQLIIDDSQVNVLTAISIDNGSTIKAINNSRLMFDYDTDFTIENASTLELEDSRLFKDCGGTVKVLDASTFSVKRSIVTLEDCTLELDGGSLMHLTENSGLNMEEGGEIIGHCVTYSDDPYRETIPGDRLIVEKSRFGLYGVDIMGNPVWDGIRIIDSKANYSLANGSYISSICLITNTRQIRLDNSTLNISRSEMSGCGGLTAYNDSEVYLRNTNYHDNDNGVYIESSYLRANDSQIINNNNNGLTLQYPGNAPHMLFPGNVISGNNGNGIQCINSPFSLQGEIKDNAIRGIQDTGTVSSDIGYNTVIGNNGSAEVLSTELSFPTFWGNHSELPDPYVYDNNGIQSTVFDQYLLAVVGNISNPPLDATGITIDTSDQTRFLPNFNSFSFESQTEYAASQMYISAFDSIRTENYVFAFDKLIDITKLYPKTNSSKKAIALLPYVADAAKGSPESLLMHLEKLESDLFRDADSSTEELQYVIIQAKAMTHLAYKNYSEAITNLEHIIAAPPSDEQGLQAMLDEAYCYYKLASSGARDLPNCRVKTATYEEYLEVRDEITEQLLSGKISDNNQDAVNAVTLRGNYPNPFNPTTNINFALPQDTNVTLSVYNLKGQKVKTLVNEHMDSGSHQVAWDGKDNNGETAASGVYFYRLNAGSKTITKKMLMLK